MKSSILSILLATCLTAISAAGSFALTIDDVAIDGSGAPDSLIYYDNGTFQNRAMLNITRVWTTPNTGLIFLVPLVYGLLISIWIPFNMTLHTS